ncbi:ACT domain-containing protein [Actinomycetospora soli]|uniref:ACT domain-containing protein n=1 Tax=Actinomycetospora soli TaxID=2893887 RepID=UPI001E369F7F|nr:ACT domain-containing protein [Actinomycetospora soli]MCD2188277.1 ACT domain-containing protein [Actinomycetospora soli]
MTGSTDLARMLASLDAVVRDGEFVYATVAAGHPATARAHAVVVEEEGVTLVLPRPDADALGVPYGFVAAWLTLTVHSSLEAVGLTAAFSRVLADAGISCNVLAGVHHDHLLVPAHERDRALAALRSLRGPAGRPAEAGDRDD